MKKILPYIFIFLILVNVFAPFTVSLTRTSIEKNIASADPACKLVYATFNLGFPRTGLVRTDAMTVTLNIKTQNCKNEYLAGNITGNGNMMFSMPQRQITDDLTTITLKPGEQNCTAAGCQVGYRLFLDHTPDGGGRFGPMSGYTSKAEDELNYKCANTPCVETIAWSEVRPDGTTSTEQQLEQELTATNAVKAAEKKMQEACAKDANSQECKDAAAAYANAQKALSDAKNKVGKPAIDALPSCGIFGDSSIMGCVVKIAYYVLFVPTSYIFALTGMFFDWTFAYSVNDTSYRSPFVLEGWAIIRDFCNMFFIFVLLYVAFTTILGMGGHGHGPNTKELIVNVIIIGVLINFSLFAAQLIIDTSNILARVFYNSNTIKVTINGSNEVENTAAMGGIALYNADGGTLQLSAAIVGKVNPVMLVQNSKEIGNIDQDPDTKAGQLGTGTWILAIILATAVNIVGMIVFLSVGLIFIARVIGLWMSMIFAPLAFFSYTVPAMQGINMVGWKKWWPELISMAFLAPVFIFFLYLIIKFLGTDILGSTKDKHGIQFVVATVVPFAFIMILMWKAKDIAKKMSGELGQSITGGIAAAGGLALGGAALGTAVLGRKVIGGTMARASRGDTATQRYEAGTAKGMAKYTGFVGSKLGLGKVFGKDIGAKDAKTGKALGVSTGLGGVLNKKQRSVGDIDHERHEFDSIKDKAGLKGVDESKLSGVNEQKLKETYVKEKTSSVESEIRSGKAKDSSGKAIALGKDANGNDLIGEDAFKANKRGVAVATMKQDPANIAKDKNGKPTGELTDEAKKKVENELNVQLNAVLKTETANKVDHDYDHLRTGATKKVSGVDRVIARSNTATYDPRNISQIKTDKREGFFTKASAGLIAGIAMGVRTGLKSSNINHGSGQNDFLKDIGHTITEAMKGAKVAVKVEESHSHGGDAHGGDHGGGGHH